MEYSCEWIRAGGRLSGSHSRLPVLTAQTYVVHRDGIVIAYYSMVYGEAALEKCPSSVREGMPSQYPVFALFDLAPRQPFRVIGEQIDGSFELDRQSYLLEPKWEKKALPEADLLVFRGKIEGKSAFTLGLFVALNDIGRQAKEAILRVKQPTFFVMNGYDLMMMLSEAVGLIDSLRRRIRRLAEEGAVCLPFAEPNDLESGERGQFNGAVYPSR